MLCFPRIVLNASRGTVCGTLFVVIVHSNDYVPPLIQVGELSVTREGVSLSTGKIFKKLRTEPRKTLLDSKEAQQLYSNLASAAESGWDFSSRWFSRDYNETADRTKWLGYSKTNDVIPVDLNSILCLNERLLSTFHRIVGDNSQENMYRTAYAKRVTAMQDIFWHATAGAWFDHSLSSGRAREDFFPSNLFPLYAGCVDPSMKAATEDRVFNYFMDKNLLKFPSGIPTSLLQTGQQWDMPNAWPPLQDVVISTLADSDNVAARGSAVHLAQAWVYSNWRGWKRTKHMFEKYVVTSEGYRGGGGEYDVQEGFGWTNGVVLSLLERFGDELSVHDDSTNRDVPNMASLLTLIASVTLLLLLATP